VRSHQHFNDIPILVITTQKEDTIRNQVLSAGANAFLIKPFQPQDILTEVKSLIG
jgi:CheY-like chemotaxis protein